MTVTTPRCPGPVDPRISVRGLCKTFVLHTQGGARIEAFSGLDLDVMDGECLALHGPSGAGKSTLLRALYANYRPTKGSILLRKDQGRLDLAAADARDILAARRDVLGYVSQFLRVIPRVSCVDIVAEPLVGREMHRDEARERAAALLSRLRIPPRLHTLAPATFSGGEQQRVNIARGFIREYPVLLLDEPTASLDAANRDTVVALIREAKARGAAIVGIFHDEAVRDAVADRVFDLTRGAVAGPALEKTA